MKWKVISGATLGGGCHGVGRSERVDQRGETREREGTAWGSGKAGLSPRSHQSWPSLAGPEASGQNNPPLESRGPTHIHLLPAHSLPIL